MPFLWGFLGSIALEIIEISQHYNKNPKKLPLKYRKIGFYFARLFVAAIGGGLALAHDTQSPVLAIQIGASAPLILQKVSATAMSSDSAQEGESQSVVNSEQQQSN